MAARHPRGKHSDVIVHYPTPNGFAHRPPKLDKHKSSEADLSKWPWKMTPHIALEWDARLEKVVSKESQVGISWHHLPPDIQKTCNISSSPSGLADVIGVPPELFELNDLQDVLSIEVWNTCLSDSERQVLHKFLPTGIDHESALLPLLSGDNFHFGNPLTSWGASVCKGDCHPDVLSRRDLDLKESHNGYYSDVQSYHGKMLNKLKRWKELCSSCKNYEEEFPLKLESWRKNQHSKKGGMCSVDALKGGSIRTFNETQGSKFQSKLNDDISSRQRLKKRKIESLQDAPEKTCMVSAGANVDSQTENFTIKVTKQQYADIVLRKRAGKDLCMETLKTIMKDGKQNSGNVRQRDDLRVREHWSKIVKQDLPIAYSKFVSKIAEMKSQVKTVAEQFKQCVLESMNKVSEATASSPQDSGESYEVEDDAKTASSDNSLTSTEFPSGVSKTLDSSLIANFPKLEVDSKDDFPPSDAEGDPERGDSIASHSKRSEKHSDSASDDEVSAIRNIWSSEKGGVVVPETKDDGPFFTGRNSDIWDTRLGSVSNNKVGSSTQSCIALGEDEIENSVPQMPPFFDKGGGREEMYSTATNIGFVHSNNNNNNNSSLRSQRQREGRGLYRKGDQGSEGSSDALHQQFLNTHQSPGSVDSLQFCSSSNLSQRQSHSSEGVAGHLFQQMQQDGQQKLPLESSSSVRLFSPSHTLASLDEAHAPRMPVVPDSDMANPLDKYSRSVKDLCAGTESSPIMDHHQHRKARLEQEMIGQSSYGLYQHLPPPPSHSAQDLFSCSSVAPSILPGWSSPQAGNLGSSSAMGFTPHSGQWNGDALRPNWPHMDSIPGSKEGELRVLSNNYSNWGGQAQSLDLSMLDSDSRKPNSRYISKAVSSNLYPCQQQGEGEGEDEQPQQAFQCSRESPQNGLISCNDKDGLIYRGGDRGVGGKGGGHRNIPYMMNQLVLTQAGGEQVSERGQQDTISGYHRFSKTDSHLGIRYNQ